MKILIANRGEIACRIIKTCKKLGIETVSLYTADEKFNLHVKQSDYKIELPEGPFKNNYLNVDLIISKALELNVKAVHPGYGFFSEIAEACLKFEQAGIIWIGPSYQNIFDMANKHTSKDIAEKLKIPTCKYIIVKSIEDCLNAVEEIRYPVMLKISGGGGGLGIFRCENDIDIRKNFPRVQNINKSLYNDSEIFIEKFIGDAHHIEVQVVGDGKGNVVTLGERECSIQRRNQKVVEETPAPCLNDEIRKRLFEDSIRLASYLKYKSVGTIEFLFDEATKEHYLIEVNTRLQVEHPITEQTFGVDIVEIMIKIALYDDFKIISERKLNQIGHSIEVRICAEDPSNKFTPSFGRISCVDFKKIDSIRVDTWIENDSFVSPLYDSLLGKAISYASTREKAIDNLIDWLENSTIQGVSTNIYFLASIIKNETFRSGNTLTKFLNTFSYQSYSCNVIESGMFPLIVDYPGRINYWNVGIPPSGPIDTRNHRISNYLVGNQENDATIEILLDCFVLKFFCDSLIAVTGTSCDIKIDGRSVNMFESVNIKQNNTLEIRLTSQYGCRAYLAIQGGIKTVPYLGSRSTFVAGKLGGLHGEPLRINDTLPLMKIPPKMINRKWPSELIPKMTNEWTILALAGPHGLDYLTEEDFENIWNTSFQVSHNANRLGVRLNGFIPKWTRKDGGDAGFHPSNVHDYAYSIGSVNFSGNFPIILTVDGPSLGGFVCPLSIIQSEFWKIGQLRPGDTIRFKQVNYDYAVKSLKNEASLLSNLKEVYDLEIPELGTTYIDPIIEKYQKNHLNFIFRLSGDSHLLFELKMEKFEMENRFYMQYVVNDLKKNKINGLLEIVPGVSSLLIKYDPFIILANEISKKIIDIISLSTNESIENMVIPCRNVKLPISFRDRWTLDAIEKYMKTISNKAPYLPDNCEFVRKINEISSLDDLAKLISETKYIIFGLGDVYLGAPCAIPFDPRHRIITTKYNPARTFTPEGAVGIGGIYMCIYGMDSPGGYQLVGKTINIWNTYNNPPWLLDFFDIVQFYLVSDEDLIRIREDYKLGKYEPMIEPTTISLFEYKSFIESNKDSIREYEKIHDIKEISNRIDWSMIEHFDTNNENSIQDSKEDVDLKDCYLMKSSHYGNLYEMKVEDCEKVKKGQTLALIEIMKTYHELKCPIDATVFKLFAKPGKIVKQGQLIAALKIE